MAARKPSPEVRIKVRAYDGGQMEGTVTRDLAVPLIYYMMSPEERIKVRGRLAECDARIAKDETEKSNG